jgi:hypothetical protein
VNRSTREITTDLGDEVKDLRGLASDAKQVAGSVSDPRYCQTTVISFAGHPLARTYQRQVHHDTLGQ